MAASLQQWVGQTVSVITCDGRNLVGELRGVDKVTNVILSRCKERVFSPEEERREVPLGLYVIRGHNIAVIGELDADKDAEMDGSKSRAEPLHPVVH